ncbi:hypothetical protein [Telmatospirillum sp. J64-1]|uniref:hypothetical protein n=1 Tax=Telmatospirillum sp. J64-1 TaxID=2502183 RepID=UPI00115D264D|nr:hypothetical protein [Telmatospirillum sp. J64-1]
MFGFLKDLFLTKKAKAALEKKARAEARAKKAKPRTEREARIAQMQDKAKDLVTPDRAELIRKAMEVQRAKKVILADLSDEQRQRLVATAMKRLLNEGRQKD